MAPEQAQPPHQLHQNHGGGDGKSVAIVGSGIAGLSAAHILSRNGWRVHIFERESSLGMASHGIFVPRKNAARQLDADDANEVEEGSDKSFTRVDVPLRVFSRTFYPQLYALYRSIGVEVVDADYSFSCSSLDTDATLFQYFVPEKLPFLPLPVLSAVFRYGPRAVGLLWELVHFLALAPFYATSLDALRLTFGQFLESRRYSKRFVRSLLAPMMSVVCTCSYNAVLRYPAHLLVDYLAKHGMLSLPWRKTCQCRLKDGIPHMTKILAKEATAVHLGTKVEAIHPATGPQGEHPTATVVIRIALERSALASHFA